MDMKANVGATVQLLIEKFRLIGIISYGTSGSTSDKLDVPNVAVPTYVAYGSAWKWQVLNHTSSLPQNKSPL